MGKKEGMVRIIIFWTSVLWLFILWLLFLNYSNLDNTSFFHSAPSDEDMAIEDYDIESENNDTYDKLLQEYAQSEKDFWREIEWDINSEDDGSETENKSGSKELDTIDSVKSDEMLINENEVKVEVLNKKTRIDEFLKDAYSSWYSTVSDRVNAPTVGLGDNTLLEDVFDASWSEGQLFYISYDSRFIQDDSSIAKVLYDEAYIYGQKELHENVYEFAWNKDKQKFTYPSGVDAILLPGVRISFNQEKAKLKILKEPFYYQQYSFTSSRYWSEWLPTNLETILSQQKVNFESYFKTTWDNYVTNEGRVIIKTWKLEISQLLIGPEIYAVRGLRTLWVMPDKGTAYKVVWNPYINTFVYESGYEVSLSNGDKLYQLVDNDSYDIDWLRSVWYIDYGNHVSWCVRTKRLNGYQFDLQFPFGKWPYESMLWNRTQLDWYLWVSPDPVKNISWFLSTRDNRWDMVIDDSQFPEWTNLIEFVMHSDSPLWKIFGHAAIAVKYAGKRWVMDPYVRVPGYAEEEPKEIHDWIKSDRAATHLWIAKVFYFHTKVWVQWMAKGELAEYIEKVESL